LIEFIHKSDMHLCAVWNYCIECDCRAWRPGYTLHVSLLAIADNSNCFKYEGKYFLFIFQSVYLFESSQMDHTLSASISRWHYVTLWKCLPVTGLDDRQLFAQVAS